MKIIEFYFYNKKTNWNLESTTFNKLTLLLGVSGVGKSKILRALDDVKSISKGKCPGPIQWSIKFETSPEQEYIWEGEFEERNDNSKYASIGIKYEKLTLNGTEIFFHDENKCVFLSKTITKLPLTESLIYTLKEEEAILPIIQGFKQVTLLNHNFTTDKISSISQLYQQYDSQEKVISSDLTIILKLALIYQNNRIIFNKIKENFCEIFPNVEDIKIEQLNIEHLVSKELPILQVKEYSVDYWIPFNEMSSSMQKNLIFLSQIYITTPESIILIDNVEDSLGIDCINILWDKILKNPNNAQIILTSHHPYIINSVPIEVLKLVVRKNSTVRAIDVKTLQSWPKSNHDTFIKLINLPEFENGIVND